MGKAVRLFTPLLLAGAPLAEAQGYGCAELASYVPRVSAPLGTQTVPLPNMSLVWACANYGGLEAAAAEFGMTGRDIAAHAGFSDSVSTRLPNMGRQSLARHTEAVLNGLRNGMRLFEALRHANESWPPQPYPDSGQTLPKVYRGDGWSRLVNVYVSQAEGDVLFGELKDSWYWFKP